MSDDAPKKLLVRRPSRITTDGHGRSVWADPVESAELELVSTQMLKAILVSRDDSERKAVAEAADTVADGVLARDPATGLFEIIDDDDLQEILDDNDDLPKLSRPADATLEPLRDYADDESLSLVSSQALRRVLGDAKDEEEDEQESGEAQELQPAGFDPYNNG